MRKLGIITVLMILLLSMSGCGTSSQSENQSKEQKVTIDYSKLNLKDLTWSGIDPLSGDKYILSFDENNVKLQYTLKGLAVKYDSTTKKGVIVYNNYKGKLLRKSDFRGNYK